MDYISEFFLIMVATLVANWLWQLWLDKREAKNQKIKTLKDFLGKIHSCILELEYNASPGVGVPSCPFKLKDQEELLRFTEVNLLGEVLANSLKRLITDAGVANGGLSLRGPRGIQGMSNLVKESLQKRSEELKASSDTFPRNG